MDKNEALKLPKEIVVSRPELACGGFYTHEIRSSPTGEVELRLLAPLDADSRNTINSKLTTR